jgi:hypothetical protein
MMQIGMIFLVGVVVMFSGCGHTMGNPSGKRPHTITIKGQIVGESSRAYLILAADSQEFSDSFWVPKSQTKIQGDRITIPYSLYVEKPRQDHF